MQSPRAGANDQRRERTLAAAIIAPAFAGPALEFFTTRRTRDVSPRVCLMKASARSVACHPEAARGRGI